VLLQQKIRYDFTQSSSPDVVFEKSEKAHFGTHVKVWIIRVLDWYKPKLHLPNKSYCILQYQISIGEFKGEWLGRSYRGLHRTEIESTGFIETFARLKLQRLYFCLLQEIRKNQLWRPDFLLLIWVPIIWFLWGPHNCKSGPENLVEMLLVVSEMKTRG
jgi:hypothetical protein